MGSQVLKRKEGEGEMFCHQISLFFKSLLSKIKTWQYYASSYLAENLFREIQKSRNQFFLGVQGGK